MMNRFFAGFLLLFISGFSVYAQEDQFEDLLNEKVINENPIYKPMIGIGSGVFSFLGDVKNNYPNPLLGDYGYKINISTFVDSKRYLKLNLNFLYGQTSGDKRSITEPLDNLNFKTDLVNFGINFEYSFNHIIQKKSLIRPFISLGIENFQFTPKGDIYTTIDNIQYEYQYWSDGSIRDIPENVGDISLSNVLHRDYSYESDLRQRERSLNMGTYSKNAFAIPVDLGISMKISERVGIKLGSSLHYTFSDYIDNVSSTGTSVVGKKGNDMLLYNYFALDFDLFSEPKTVIVEKMFAELEFDEVMFDDEDGDFILDAVDECPGTPYGIATDTLGCPLDEDLDGIPDYLDKEKFSAPNAWVDAEGRTISEEVFLAQLMNRNEAMNRSDVLAYMETIGKSYVRKSVEEIPEKFKNLDIDKDGYISFEELLQAIDNYFDQKLQLNVDDIYDLNNFFFGQ